MTINVLRVGAVEERQLRLIHLIAQIATETDSTQVQMKLLDSRLGDLGQSTSSLTSDLEAMKDRGEVNFFPTLAGIGQVILLQPGMDQAAQVDEVRNSSVARRKYLRDAYLRWLDNNRDKTPRDYMATSPNILGYLYEEADLQQAGEWLQKAGYIEGPGSWSHPAPLRPRITAKGEDAVESGRSVNDLAATATHSFQTVVHGNANVANASHNVAQTQTNNQA